MTNNADLTASVESPAQFTVDEVGPSYWRVTFANGPVNLIDPDSVEQLAQLVTRIEESPTLTVVVFDSANPDYFMAHWDLKSAGYAWPRWHRGRRGSIRTSTT